MARIGFYHLVRQPLEQVLPKLLEKAITSGARVVVLAGSKERVAHLDDHLWVYRDDSWLPHGSDPDGPTADPNASQHPIWLTHTEENPNQATILITCDGAHVSRLDLWPRCLDLFDGNDDQAVTAARSRWKLWKEQGHELVYYQQSDRGGWEEKARG
jgi:DNA polymerase III subunit chi